MAKYSKKAQEKIGEVMHEFQEGTLKSGKNGIGGKVKSRKQAIAIGISETVVAAKTLDAGKIIKEIVSPLIKGGGGGQKTLATAGGQDVSNFAALINQVRSLL